LFKIKQYFINNQITLFDRYGLLPACIVEELAQAMGLPNDSGLVNPSVANDKSVLELLTGLDDFMLRIIFIFIGDFKKGFFYVIFRLPRCTLPIIGISY
jgi:hypothetical protein